MTGGSDHLLFILAAYGLAAVLLGAEVWQLLARSRKPGRLAEPLDDDG